jgi:hypothetical protein
VGTADGGAASTSGRDGGAVGEATVGTRRGRRGGRDGGAVSEVTVGTRRGRGEAVGTATRSTGRRSARRGVRGEAAVGRAVPTAALSPAVDAVRGGHAAVVRFRACPAWRTAADR